MHNFFSSVLFLPSRYLSRGTAKPLTLSGVALAFSLSTSIWFSLSTSLVLSLSLSLVLSLSYSLVLSLSLSLSRSLSLFFSLPSLSFSLALPLLFFTPWCVWGGFPSGPHRAEGELATPVDLEKPFEAQADQHLGKQSRLDSQLGRETEWGWRRWFLSHLSCSNEPIFDCTWFNWVGLRANCQVIR